MANYYAAARSNSVHIDDMAGLIQALNPFSDLKITEDTPDSGLYCILCEEGWPGFGIDDDDMEVEFDPLKHIVPFIREGEVFVMMEVGHEKLRYLVGFANAYCRAADGEVLQWGVSIDDIYSAAAREFGVDRDSINPAQY